MPTLEEWEQALSAPQRLVIESSPSLLTEVRQRISQKDADRRAKKQKIPACKNSLSVVAAFAPELELDVAPAYLLHRLGVVTTPAIENLADICSTWAYFRYLWAFEVPPTNTPNWPLRLSAAARDIDFHQKGLLSDQIGVGMAALLLGSYMDAPLAADVSVAMNDPNWPIDLQHKTSPDYLFFNATQTALFVVECKGTQTSRAASLEQLRRGTEQVPSLIFMDGRRPPSIVVGTYLSTNGIRTFIIDPPGDDDAGQPGNSDAERVSETEFRIRNEAAFARTTRLLSEAKILSFAGAFEDAYAKIESTHRQVRRPQRSTSREPQIFENEFGTFRGIRQRVGLRDRFNIDVVQALDLPLYKAFAADEPARTNEELLAFQKRRQVAGEDDVSQHTVHASREKGSVVVRSTAPDGSLLEVHVSPP